MILPSLRSRSLVGRDAEMQLLRDTRRSLSSGRGAVVLVGGEAGLGKSRLLAEFAQTLSGGRAPLYAIGECLEYAPSAFGPVRQILETLARIAPWAADAAPPLAQRMLRTLVPHVMETGNNDVPTAPLERAELFAGVLAYLTTIAAKRATVVAIEDLHWADAASLEMIGHLASRIAPIRLMLVATYRDDNVSSTHPLFAALARLGRSNAVTFAALEPLPDGDITTLALDALAGRYELAPARLRDIVARSEGNPLFAEELLKKALVVAEPGTPLPISIRGVILERVNGLAADERYVIEHAAMLGPRFTATTLALVLDRTGESLAPTLQRLCAVDLLVREPEPDYLRFRHALTRAAVSGELTTDVRQLHATIARKLASLPDADDRVDELAYHTWEANLRDEALLYNERAGERALLLRAPVHAAMYFQRALALAADLPARVRILARAGFTSSQTCDFPGAIAAYTTLYELELARADHDAAGAALLRAANETANTGRGGDAAALLQTFLTTYGNRLRQETTDYVNATLAWLATTSEQYGRSGELLDGIAEPARLATHPFQIYWYSQLYNAAEQSLDLLAWRSAAKALRSRLDEAYPLARTQQLHSIGATALVFAENDEAERSLDEAIAFDREHGLTAALAYASAVKVRLLLQLGRLSEAVPLAALALSNRDMLAVRTQLMMGGPHVALSLDDEALALRCLDETVLESARAGQQMFQFASLAVAHAVWLEHDSRSDEARRLLAEALDAIETPYTDPHFWLHAARLLDDKRVARVRHLCAQAALNPHDRVMRATAAIVEAIVAERTGDHRARLDFARRATESYRQLRWPLFEARALELGSQSDAALAIYRRCGSVTDVRRLELGAQFSRPTSARPDRLSPREREVAALVARGQTNRTISNQLHISEKTVEKHLTSIYMKLEFSTRSELAAYVARGNSHDQPLFEDVS